MSRNWFNGNPSILPPTTECTACQTTIIEKSDTRIHRELGCIICKQCYGNYALTIRETRNGEGFSLNRFGHQCRCRWCCNDKYLIACTTCRRAFCQGCVRRHDSEADILNVYRLSPDERVGHKWACFLCDTRKQVQLRQDAARFKSAQEAYSMEHRDPNCPSPPQSDEEIDDLDLYHSSETEIDDEEIIGEKGSESSLLGNQAPVRTVIIPGQDPSSQGELIKDKVDKSNEDEKEEKEESYVSTRCSYRASNWTITGHQIKDKQLHFEVSWEGFDRDFDTREPVDFAMTNHQEVKSYLKKVKQDNCYTFDALIKMTPELADVFRSSEHNFENLHVGTVKNKQKTTKTRSIRLEDYKLTPSEPALSATPEVKKRKSPSKSRSSSQSEYQSPLKKKANQTSITSETEDRNKISGNISVNVESHGNSKQSAEKRPADRQPQSMTASKSDQMIPGPSNSSVTTLGNKKPRKPRSASKKAKSDAEKATNQQPANQNNPSPVHISPAGNKSQASVSSETLVGIEETLSTFVGSQNDLHLPLMESPLSSSEKARESNTTRTSVIVTPEQSASNTSANKLSVGVTPQIESILSRLLDIPITNSLPRTHITLPASVVSDSGARSTSERGQSTEEPREETQHVAKVEPVADLLRQVSAEPEIGSKVGDPIPIDRSCVLSEAGVLITKTPVDVSAPDNELKFDICQSDIRRIPPSVPNTLIQRQTSSGQRAQIQPVSEASFRNDNQSSTTSGSTTAKPMQTNTTPSNQHDHDYRIPKLKRHYLTNSQNSKEPETKNQEKALDRSQEEDSPSRENSSTLNRTKEVTISNKLTSRYTNSVEAAHKQQTQQQQQPPKSLNSKSKCEDRNHKPSTSRTRVDSKERGLRRRSTDRDAPVGTDSRGDRRSSTHSTGRASSRDSYRSSKEGHQSKTHLKPRSQFAENPNTTRRHSADEESEPPKNGALDDNQRSRTPEATRLDRNQLFGSTRREIFSRLGDLHEQQARKSDTFVVGNNNPELERRKIYGAKPNPYRWNADYVYPSIHHKYWIPHVIETLLARIGDYKEPEEHTRGPQARESRWKESQHQIYPAARKPTQMVARKAYSIRGSLKYIGFEAVHDNGIEAVIQYSMHRVHYVQARHRTYSIPVFEVKFRGHEETVKLSMSDVLKEDFYAVKKFISIIKWKDPKRFQGWRKNNHFCYKIHCSRSPRQCLHAIERKEKYAYEAYLRDRELKDLENSIRFESR